MLFEMAQTKLNQSSHRLALLRESRNPAVTAFRIIKSSAKTWLSPFYKVPLLPPLTIPLSHFFLFVEFRIASIMSGIYFVYRFVATTILFYHFVAALDIHGFLTDARYDSNITSTIVGLWSDELYQGPTGTLTEFTVTAQYNAKSIVVGLIVKLQKVGRLGGAIDHTKFAVHSYKYFPLVFPLWNQFRCLEFRSPSISILPLLNDWI